MSRWDKYLTSRDREIYKQAGYGHRGGPGHRPAVLVVDVNFNFVGYSPKPILEAIADVSTACGDDGWQAVYAIRPLLDTARTVGAPIFYSTGTLRPERPELNSWKRKTDSTAVHRPEGNAFPSEIAPQPGDVVISKEKPSPFFGTPLASYLMGTGVDTLLVVGGTTSGCVRAAVIDAFSYNLRVQVVEEGCFDRGEVSHAINLFDMDQKYADVISLEQAIAYLHSISTQKNQ